MMKIRKAGQRGHVNHGWLDSYHTFSFASYYDAEYNQFRNLRVINEDFIEPSMGFGTHPHDNMEIITYVVSGEIAHKDSMGNGSVIRPGEIQTMSAGTGVTHSEFNPSDENKTHLYQIWVVPNEKGLLPAYQQKSYLDFRKNNELCLIASLNPDKNAVKINSDVNLFTAYLNQGKKIQQEIKERRHIWLQIISGEVLINGSELVSGDACALSDEMKFKLEARTDAEFLLFDMA